MDVLKPFQRLLNHRSGILGWVGIGVTSFRFRGSCTALKYSTKKDFAGAGLCCRLTLDGEKTMPLWDFLKCSKQGLGRTQRTLKEVDGRNLIFLETTDNLSSRSSHEDTTEMLSFRLFWFYSCEDKWIHRLYLMLCIVSDVGISVVLLCDYFFPLCLIISQTIGWRNHQLPPWVREYCV